MHDVVLSVALQMPGTRKPIARGKGTAFAATHDFSPNSSTMLGWARPKLIA
jgi:hypothetical protein